MVKVSIKAPVQMPCGRCSTVSITVSGLAMGCLRRYFQPETHDVQIDSLLVASFIFSRLGSTMGIAVKVARTNSPMTAKAIRCRGCDKISQPPAV